MWRNERAHSECEHSEIGGRAGPPLYGPHSATASRHHRAPHLNLVLHTLVVRMQLADANCTLGGLCAMAIMVLAEELTRQNGVPKQRLSDRQMEVTCPRFPGPA